MEILKQYYVSDFETTSEKQYKIEGETRVYLHYTENIYNDSDNFLGCNIKDYFNFLCKAPLQKTKRIIYFHNLTFDGQFIEYHLNRSGFTNTLKLGNKQYTIIRSEMPKSIYQIQVKISKNLTLEFRDSLKLLQVSVDNLPNIRGIKKLKKYDYTRIRTETKISDFSDYDLEYVKHDVWKVKDVLKVLLQDIGDYLTIGASSYHEWKQMFNKDDKWNYINTFPKIPNEINDILRKAYNGGIVILNPEYKGKIIKETLDVYDVNSLYPSQMLLEMPYGYPMNILNKDNEKMLNKLGFNFKVYSVYVKSMTIKKGYFPFIDVTKNYTLGKKAEYPKTITNSILWLTSIDLDNIIKYYNIDYLINYKLSFAFKTKLGIFEEYINKFRKMKENAKTPFERMFAKYRLNTLYGKFGTNPDRLSCLTIFDNDMIEYEIMETKLKEQYYLPIAICITARARNVLITALQNERESFVYCDTDSLHVISKKFKNEIPIHPTKFGYWDFEGRFKYSYYYSNKQYLHYQNGVITRTIASLSKSSHRLVNFSNMHKGSVIQNGKKLSKHVKGGRLIVNTKFTFN